VTVNPTAGGTVTAAPLPPYNLNDVVTLSQTPNLGYTFTGWSGDGADSGGNRVVTITGNMAVTASYTQDVYTLTVTVNPTAGGTVTADIPPPYHLNDVVVLTESPNTGYTFSGWSGDGTGTGTTRTVTITGNMAVTATFTVSTPQTITLRPNAAGSTTELNAQGSGSANWDRVDEVTADESTTYVRGTADQTRQTDTYNVLDQSLTGSITNVRIYIRARESIDRNDVYAWTAIRIGTGSIQYGSQIGTTTSWTNYYTDYATKTGNLGSGAWTWTDINNLQIGVGLLSDQGSSEWRYAQCTQVWVEVTYTP
jgi:uncharacterized repeat protein (TIGR02543 family)